MLVRTFLTSLPTGAFAVQLNCWNYLSNASKCPNLLGMNSVAQCIEGNIRLSGLGVDNGNNGNGTVEEPDQMEPTSREDVKPFRKQGQPVISTFSRCSFVSQSASPWGRHWVIRDGWLRLDQERQGAAVAQFAPHDPPYNKCDALV